MGRFADALSRIDDALQAGDARAAFSTLRPWLAFPPRVEEPDWPAALDALRRVGRDIVGESFVEVATAARDADDVPALYDLGYELIEQELPDLAATFLARAVRKRPDLPGLLSELVTALERDGRHGEACRRLLGAPDLLAKGFPLRYLLAWNTALRGDLVGARTRMSSLGEPGNGEEAEMRDRLEALLQRAEGIRGFTPLDGDDLRGWHFVLHGACLLRLSPHGFKEGMRGRYAYTQDSELRCREAVERVRVTLRAMGVAPARVLTLPDRDSAILGAAAAKVLGVPSVPWSSDTSGDAGLIVAYDLGAVEPDTLAELRPHRSGQVLWEHASRWVGDRPVAADLVTYLYQYNVAPWAEHVVIDKDSGGAIRTHADDSSPAEIAARIADLALSDNDLLDRTPLIDFARACLNVRVEGEPGAAPLREVGLRVRQVTGGPVQSSKFV